MPEEFNRISQCSFWDERTNDHYLIGKGDWKIGEENYDISLVLTEYNDKKMRNSKYIVAIKSLITKLFSSSVFVERRVGVYANAGETKTQNK